MPTYYVSGTASNGYVVGSDGNSGLTKALAKATHAGAMAVAVGGDTIQFNDGTYNSASVFNHNAAVNLACETYRGTTIRCTAVGSRGFLCNHPDGTTVNIGALVFDDNNASTVSFELNPGAAIKYLNCTGSEFKGGTSYTFQGSGIVGVSLTDTKYTGAATIAGMGATILGAGAYVNMDVCELALTNATNGLYFQGTPATPAYCRVKAPFGSVNKASGGITAINFNGVNACLEGDLARVLTIPATSGASNAIATVRSLAGYTGGPPLIRDLRCENLASGGYAIRVGSDGTAGAEDNLIPGGVVMNCDVLGSGGAMHGIMFGSMNGGVACGNRIRNMGIALLSKLQQTGATFCGNDIAECTTGADAAMETKNCTTRGATFAFNDLHFRTGFEGKALLAQTANVGGDLLANNIHIESGNVVSVVTVANDASSLSTIGWNNYFVQGALGGNPFQYTATFYTSVANWGAAREPTYRAVKPTDVSIRFFRYGYEALRRVAFRAMPWLREIG